MKKGCLLLAVFLMIFGGTLGGGRPEPARAEETFTTDASSTEFDFQSVLKEFVTEHPNREAGSTGEEQAAATLRQTLSQAGLTPYEQYFQGSGESFYQNVEGGRGSSLIFSRNVIGVLETSGESEGMLMIGAHYDNAANYVSQLSSEEIVVSGQPEAFQGAYDNGSGVTVLLSLIDRFSEADLPFDVVFCLFGAEEPGLYGSETFVSSLTEEQRADILLYVNLDSIAAGDYLYLYTDEVSTLHDAFFREQAQAAGITLTENPANKKISAGGLKYFPYLHVGLSSDHLSFMQYRINVANFFTLNWSSKATYVDESLTKPNIMHTKKDNADTLFLLYPQTAVRYMENVSDLVVAAATDSEFVSTMRQSMEQKPNYDFWLMQWPALLIGLAAILGAGLALFLIYRKWSAYRIPGDNGSSGGQESVFGDEFE